MSEFQILPAIDMIDGQCVRLIKGDYAQKTVYAPDPVAKAREFKALGADSIHLVDLDGAKAGKPLNHAIVKAVKKETGLFAEIGGGIRTMEQIEDYLAAGLDRVILGTSAVQNKDLVAEAAKKYGKNIAVGIDAKDGKVAIAGWEEKSSLDPFDFAKLIEDMGIATIIYTDISRDGMLIGPNLEAMAKMAETVSLNVIASGGVTKNEDIANLKKTGVAGAIIGKALYTGDVDLKKVLED
ncbi:MAG: 1-(5-phosphoribosyl)-5-[(5-phosphoribosylamino)methylideneamino]imidazole-4-carboxamide isomerase [Bacillota bacterium]|nr:1-(5-phosphoribosyl)-5-[(5-phosphoribosylamino)methylideneamino]imidazole-4-carboxamide isomerase [Bacillota bacterium]